MHSPRVTQSHRFRVGILLIFLILPGFLSAEEDFRAPPKRQPRLVPAASESAYRIDPTKPKQVIAGIGFEIQSDSIASGNAGLSEAIIAVPHDLVPSERIRFATEMLSGFRYCRLAGGLYWRGLDAEGRQFRPRWPEQLAELREMLDAAKLDGVMFEYWSPAPFWKANGKLTGKDGSDNTLRCFGKNFANDPVYHGNKARFLADFAQACRTDLETLKANGIRTRLWGMQNEPTQNVAYSSCKYTIPDFVEAFQAVVPVMKAWDPGLKIIGDSMGLSHMRPIIKDPKLAGLVDWLTIHQIASNANIVKPAITKLRAQGVTHPVIQNEFEYSATSHDLCLNTVMHIMNWFQIGEAPSWFWIHALKPKLNSEASGYALGFWHPTVDTDPKNEAKYHGLKPGHWEPNPYNWNAVGSFVRHMPWDCRAVTVEEANYDEDLRILSFIRPNGKLSIVVANRSFSSHTFNLAIGLTGATFKGFRYTPDQAGDGTRGVAIGTLAGESIAPTVPDMAWEFWEQD
jgi:hypothetical protein